MSAPVGDRGGILLCRHQGEAEVGFCYSTPMGDRGGILLRRHLWATKMGFYYTTRDFVTKAWGQYFSYQILGSNLPKSDTSGMARKFVEKGSGLERTADIESLDRGWFDGRFSDLEMSDFCVLGLVGFVSSSRSIRL
ncbi:hypothetical protein M5K25_023788 [Dendrobium thyrsiflorum]|uniref:Uncharacterized protein n=1 Tax=Dendrobium thyrsiflorum TaxID=117978 RepID=A0ABD0U0I3_DENTH